MINSSKNNYKNVHNKFHKDNHKNDHKVIMWLTIVKIIKTNTKLKK